MTLRAPFPYFGGKSRIAAEVWSRLGDAPNYVEPFAGSSLAVLLSRPHAPKTETVNDKDRFLANFWRAVQSDPEAVAHHADWPVNEADLEARHYWLVTEGAKRLETLTGDPLAFDAQVAGWWLWGICSWIGGGWCSGDGPWQWEAGKWEARPRGRGINHQLPHLSGGRGINRQLPHVGNTGRGINKTLSGTTRAEFIRDWMVRLSERLRHVRVAWKAHGGYGAQANGRGRANASREMLWFSPHCLKPLENRSLFDLIGDEEDAA